MPVEVDLKSQEKGKTQKFDEVVVWAWIKNLLCVGLNNEIYWYGSNCALEAPNGVNENNCNNKYADMIIFKT